MVFTLPADYDRIRFYGYGPLDNYADRQQGAKLGIYETKVKEEVEPYLLPQECGNHGGIRWFEVTDNRGRGVRIRILLKLRDGLIRFSFILRREIIE